MIADLIRKIQAQPDWIGLGILAIFLLAVICIALFIWRRSTLVETARIETKSLDAKIVALEQNVMEQNQQLSDLRREIVELEKNEARLDEALHQQKQANEEKVAILNATGEKLKGEFKNLAADVMRTHGEEFERSNQTRLKQVLEPLKQNIDQFKTEMQTVQKETIAERATLKNEIKTLTERSMRVSEEAENLTRALKSDTQKQGAWGEMILASILDRSGLREGHEYETQTHHRDDDGRSLRPDVTINLPNQRRLVIDSKVSLVAYERASNAHDDDSMITAMKAHVASVRTHIDTLSKKKYHQLDDNSVDYVIMFMPIESAFAEAVRVDPDLALYAVEKNVVIASPTNLMVALKTVENLWSVERRNKNGIEIAKRAGLLYDKFANFSEDLVKVGKQLDTAQATHAAAMGKLTEGRGNLVAQVETLKKLGARAAKQIELDHDHDDDDALLSDLSPKNE